MEQEFKDKIKEDKTLQSQLLDILKGTETGKAYTETVAKNYFEQNISQEHKCGNRCKKCEAFLCGDCNGCGNF